MSAVERCLQPRARDVRNSILRVENEGMSEKVMNWGCGVWGRVRPPASLANGKRHQSAIDARMRLERGDFTRQQGEMRGAAALGIVLVMRAPSYCLQRSSVRNSLGALNGGTNVVVVVPAGVLAATQQQRLPHNSNRMHAMQPCITHKSSTPAATWNTVPTGPGISPPTNMATRPMGELMTSSTAWRPTLASCSIELRVRVRL